MKQLFVPFVSVACFLAGAGYMVVRYGGHGFSGNLFPIAVFLLSWVCLYSLGKAKLHEPQDGRWLVPFWLTGAICMFFFGEALSRHMWRGLVALNHLRDTKPGYTIWETDGRTRTADHDLPLKSFHRQGDETAHLTAALAVREACANPFRIRALIGTREGYDRSYWLRRSLSGHLPGLAVLFAPVATNPPLARVWAFTITILCALLAFWAGNRWYQNGGYGWLAAITFVSIPNLGWWHAFSVSSDVPPALFTFLACGFVALAFKDEELVTWKFALVGLFLGLGTCVTVTAALPAGALFLITLLSRKKGAALCGITLVLPVVLAIVLSIAYTRLAIPDGGHVLLSRIEAINETKSTFTFPLQGLITFVRRFPMDLGLPLTIMWIVLPMRMFWNRRSILGINPSVRFIGALAVLVPAACFFWPEIRFTYPGILVVLWGLGFQDYWEELSPTSKAVTIANIGAFGLAKFVLHNLLVVG